MKATILTGTCMRQTLRYIWHGDPFDIALIDGEIFTDEVINEHIDLFESKDQSAIRDALEKATTEGRVIICHNREEAIVEYDRFLVSIGNIKPGEFVAMPDSRRWWFLKENGVMIDP